MTEPRASIAVVTFPGSNDDGDARLALEQLGAEAVPVWHATTELPVGVGGVILPGGFSYGDYLRCGALARVAPVMGAVRSFAAAGGRCSGSATGSRSCARPASSLVCSVRTGSSSSSAPT